MIGKHGIGLHLAGSMFGLNDMVTAGETWAWSLYNFGFYAALPYLFFRRSGYSREKLCLTSSNVCNDTLLIVVILAMGIYPQPFLRRMDRTVAKILQTERTTPVQYITMRRLGPPKPTRP
jgi:hypothetical protein